MEREARLRELVNPLGEPGPHVLLIPNVFVYCDEDAKVPFSQCYFKRLAEETELPCQKLIDLYLLDYAKKRKKLTMKWVA